MAGGPSRAGGNQVIGANQCQHGQLARKCQLCEDEDEIAQLKTQVRVLLEALHLIVASHSDDTYAVGIARAALEASKCLD